MASSLAPEGQSPPPPSSAQTQTQTQNQPQIKTQIKTKHPHTIVFTLPRTASNLLTTLLNLPAQPSLLAHPKDGYFYLPALLHRYEHDTFNKPPSAWTQDDRDAMREKSRTCFEAWEEWILKAESEGRGTLVKEHVNWMVDGEVEAGWLFDGDGGGRLGQHEGSGYGDGQDPEIFQRDDTSSLAGIPSYNHENPTSIPPSFLLKNLNLNPTFLIRNPLLLIPSLFRTVRDNEGLSALLAPSTLNTLRWETTYTWHIRLYNFLLSYPDAYPRASRVQDVTFPLIIDAADLGDPELVRKYAGAVGLDPGLVRYSWEAGGGGQEAEGMGKVERRMKDTLLGSTGVVPGKLVGGGELGVERERGAWEEEFGVEGAEVLERLVREAMGGYEWLFERRLRVLDYHFL
ncbi:hypothetical protein IQ07DRAFT_635502 [Pyrenochaeta sp. DS3sAY3a]|nr:hypothetical protein IQ07DRAFT_635502 [Pyrenochaeta sp. DS3sAY3a]